jgi:hypothetical protein
MNTLNAVEQEAFQSAPVFNPEKLRYHRVHKSTTGVWPLIPMTIYTAFQLFESSSL